MLSDDTTTDRQNSTKPTIPAEMKITSWNVSYNFLYYRMCANKKKILFIRVQFFGKIKNTYRKQRNEANNENFHCLF